MYTFSEQNKIGKILEDYYEIILTEAGITFGRNPYTGTPDERRAGYDHWLHYPEGIRTECKSNPKSLETGNIAIETDILDVSTSHYFIIAFVANSEPHIRSITRYEIDKLIHASIYKPGGRVYTYERRFTGQTFPDGSRKECALVPVEVALTLGVPVIEFVTNLK